MECLLSNFYCIKCKKDYSSYKSLWNHNKIFHNNNCENIEKQQQIKKSLICNICNKKFNSRATKCRHKKQCKEKNEEIQLLKEEVKTLKEQLKNTLTCCPDINKINKQLSQLQNYQNYSNNHNSNNTINHFQIVAFNKKDIIQCLSNEDRIRILLEPVRNVIEKIVEIVHCEKYTRFKNIIITNLKDKYAYIYDGNLFVPISKDDALNTLITNRKWDIDDLYSEHENMIKENVQEEVNKLIQNLDDVNVPFYDEDKKYKNMKTYKKEKISLILYNNREKMMNDVMNNISMLLSNEELSKKDLEDMAMRKKEYDL